ncbi:sugar kinase [Modestobacter sp. VKM Ac-2986]|uniref:sugar kinase n=1 Tax=Modestobacter sp. VKM Ac-2986 TaxID=3004140 RepID=UPI0022AAD6B5|nr:sugar kinase [Modestobacter sp. VKM Ac-2986]MCZ2827749.1 sugar kinase [Modestobacter sp. VKM Ac-2986]
MSTSPADVVVLGESLGLLVGEQTGHLSRGDRMRLTFGGAESNVAIGVSRLGGSAAWIGRLGADAVGAMIARELRAEGVAVHAARESTVTTALMLKERVRPGASRITYYRRGQAGSRLSPADVPADVVTSATVLHVTGISVALGEAPRAAAMHAVDLARASGTLVSFDVNHRATLVEDLDRTREGYLALAERADLLFAGNDEAELLTGESDPERQLDAMLALGAQQAVVKLGEAGAIAATANGDRLRQGAFRVSAVDTVGAGDAFVAGWLASLVDGEDVAARLDTAIRCGALACLTEGDWEAAPTREDLASLDPGHLDPVSR